MKLQIGLIADARRWGALFQQEGIPFSGVTSPDQLRPEDFSMVVASSVESHWNDAVKRYAHEGGALLTTARFYQRCFGGNGKRRMIRYLVSEDNSPLSTSGLVDTYCEGFVLDNARFCTTDGGEQSVAVEQYGNGMIAAVPFDLGSLLYDTRKRQKFFYSPARPYPSERVALVSKGAVRQLVRAVVEYLHNERGITFCHLWYYPGGARNVFALRIDTDFGTKEEIDALYRFAEENAAKMSWYLHVKGHEQWLSRFRMMQGHEIGIHCYEHAALVSASAARADIATARRLLSGNGMSAAGFAAPFGDWNENLAAVLQETGFLYSSEFSYDYDNVPSYPLVNGVRSSVLQIPVHPICLGSFKKLRASEKEMVEYFSFVVNSKLSSHEPLFFYHHPKDGHHAVLKHLIDNLKKTSAVNMLLSDFAQWWKERTGTTYSLEISADQLRVIGSSMAGQFLRLSKGQHEAIIPCSKDIDLSRIDWQEKMPAVRLTDDVRGMRSFSFRLFAEELQARFRRAYK